MGDTVEKAIEDFGAIALRVADERNEARDRVRELERANEAGYDAHRGCVHEREQLRAELAAAREELKESERVSFDMFERHRRVIQEGDAERDTLRARLALVEGLLHPFAWGMIDYATGPDAAVNYRTVRVTLEEIYAARAALTSPAAPPAAPGSVAERSWVSVDVAHPAPHARYTVRHPDCGEFQATPCYGMHRPWWVPRTVDVFAPGACVIPFDGTEWLAPRELLAEIEAELAKGGDRG